MAQQVLIIVAFTGKRRILRIKLITLYHHMPGTFGGTKIEIFMARRIRSKLEHRTSRLALPIRGKPYWLQIGDGLHQGYRRCQGNGSWSGRKSDGRGGNFIKKVGPADDYEGPRRARLLAGAAENSRTVSRWHQPRQRQAGHRGASAHRMESRPQGSRRHEGSASVVDYHLTPTLRTKIVAALSARELIAWRNSLLQKGLAPASVTRVCKSFAAALSLAARHDARITNASAWKTGLEALPDSGASRNVVVPDGGVRRIVRAGYEIGPALGLFLETAGLTGSRPVQLRRLTVGDVLKDKLAMPSSKKGKGKRRIERKPIPIPHDLAARLRVFAKGRPADAPLFIKEDGSPWPINHRDMMRDVVRRAGLDADKVTLYALRHTWITKQLIRGTPIRLVADAADTSVAMIEKTYSKYISHHGDDLLRAGLIDLTVPIADKVVPYGEARPCGHLTTRHRRRSPRCFRTVPTLSVRSLRLPRLRTNGWSSQRRRLPNREIHELVPFVAFTQDDPAFARHKPLLRRNLRDLDKLRELIAQASQGEKKRQEALYEKLLRIWVAEDGKLTVGDRETGSACAVT